MAKKIRGFRITIFSSLIYTFVIIAVTVLTKDNLIDLLRQFISPDSTSTIVNSSGSIEVAFSPNNGATATIIKAISEAKKSILVSAYNFTSKDIAQALLRAKKQNVDVKLILDKSQMSQRYSSSTFFANLGFDLRIDVKHAIYHNKVMIIDDNTVITGSFNFTKAAEEKNAENVLIIRNNPALAETYKENWLFHWQQSIPHKEYIKRKIAGENIAGKSFH